MVFRAITFIILFSVSLVLSIFFVNMFLKLNSTNFRDFSSGNILLNSDFKDGFKHWKCDNRVSLTNMNNKVFVHTEGVDKRQTRFWQDIEVVSGKVYRLKFDLKGKQDGAFAIYRNVKTGKEEYLFCKGDESLKHYLWEFEPIRTGRDTIYLSTNQKGDYYFSDALLYDKNCNTQKKILLLSCLTLFIALLFFLAFCFIIWGSFLYNITLLILIITFSLFPILKINPEIKSEIENRNLSSFSPLISNGKIDISFGKNFNDWLNDRFFGRIFCLQVNTLIRAYINNKIENGQVLAGRDRWYFRKENLILLNNHNIDVSNNYSKTMNNLLRLSKYCKDNNTDLYILVMPCNEEVYDDMLIGIKLGPKKYAIAETIEKLKKDTGVNIIYGSDTMEKAKKENFACYKTDHHWTKFGAFRNYQKLMNEINKNNEGVVALGESDFIIKEKNFPDLVGFGSLFSMLNIPKWCWSNFYPMVGSYRTFSFKGESYLKKEGDILLNLRGIDKCVLVFGDSMTTNIIDFFWDSFKKTILHREYGNIKMKNVERIIHNNKPDIAIMIIYFENFYRIKNWYN